MTMEPYNCGVVIPDSAAEFLLLHPDPSLVPAKSLEALLKRYHCEVEPHFRWHYVGPISREPACFLGCKVKTGSHADNMPGDWKWRSYLVKVRAGHRCADCGSSINLEADHILPLSVWRSDEAFDYFDYEAPHSLKKNLQCLCHSCHQKKTLKERRWKLQLS
jgi:5-methylcytosine-specific restriction endonuclease McrA